jgi:hypothetical protein
MLRNVNTVIEEKGERVRQLHEELEICRMIVEDKMKEIQSLQEEILFLQGYREPVAV